MLVLLLFGSGLFFTASVEESVKLGRYNCPLQHCHMIGGCMVIVFLAWCSELTTVEKAKEGPHHDVVAQYGLNLDHDVDGDG